MGRVLTEAEGDATSIYIMSLSERIYFQAKEVLDSISYEGPLLLLCSGGVDSMSMAHVLHHLGVHYAIYHANYGLRGDASVAEEQLIRQWAERHGIPIRVEQADENYGEKSDLQSRARQFRYGGAREYLNTLGGTHIVTAHHADDAAETFLFYAARGSGLDGLAALTPLDGDVIRPFWQLRKREIKDFATAEPVKWLEDQSNTKDVYTRNHLRHHALPALNKALPNAVGGLTTTMRHLGEVLSFVESAVQREGVLYMGESEVLPGVKVIYRDVLDHPHSGVILWYLMKDYAPFEPDTIQELAHSQVGAHIESHDWQIWSEREGLMLIQEVKDEVYPIDVKMKSTDLIGPHWDGHRWTSKVQWTLKPVKSVQGDFGSPSEPVMAWDRMPDSLCWRPWQEGDFIQPFGMKKGHKKVSDALTEAKVPSCMRRKVQVLALEDAPGEVLWIPGIRISQHVAIESQDQRFVRLNLH